MPHNITVTLANGQRHVYQNAPDNITQQQALQRAQKDFGNIGVASIDRAPTTDPAPQPKSLLSSIGDAADATRAGIARGAFGLPEIVAAGARRAVGMAQGALGLHQTDGGASYANTLQAIRANDNQSMARNRIASTAGQIAGGVAGGILGGRAIGAGVGAMAGADSGALSATGNVLQKIAQFKRGQTVANAARTVASGATAGAAQAAGEGSDIGRGAASGAAGAAVLGAGGKALSGLMGRVGDFLNTSSAGAILKRYTTMTAEQLGDAATAWRAAHNGLEPTAFELLPSADRQSLRQAIGSMPATQRENLAAAVRERGAGLGTDMAATVKSAAGPTLDENTAQIASDLAASRGQTVPTSDDHALAASAVRSPYDMANVQEQKAANIMAPYDNQVAYEKPGDLIPQHPQNSNGIVSMVPNDPDEARMISSAAGGLSGKQGGITVSDVANVIRNLKRGGNSQDFVSANAANRAAESLSAKLAADHPEAADALASMKAGWEADQKTLQGMGEGAQTRTQADVTPAEMMTNRKPIQDAYNTPEGANGRAMGQAAALENSVSGTPGQALSTTQNIAGSPNTQAAISANLGTDAGPQIATTAQALADSARKLAGLNTEVKDSNALNMPQLMHSVMMLHPGALPAAKALSLSRLGGLAPDLPPAASQQIVDALFSQNPTAVSRAMGMLYKSGDAGKTALAGIQQSLIGGNLGAQATAPGEVSAPPGDVTPITPPLPASPAPDPAAAPSAPADPSGAIPDPNSPYAPQLQAIYDREAPETMALIDKQFHQESGNRQTNADGTPVTSSKGAQGIAQIMPSTAPQAAQLAGVPLDAHALATDGTYNKLLGTSLMFHHLHSYGGDVPKALAAYNAGPGRLASAIATDPDNYLGHMPAETQDYVQRIAG